MSRKRVQRSKRESGIDRIPERKEGEEGRHGGLTENGILYQPVNINQQTIIFPQFFPVL
jgi:hypothetical protein